MHEDDATEIQAPAPSVGEVINNATTDEQSRVAADCPNERIVRYKRLPDNTSFPDNTGELEWRLRYAPDTITRGDQLVLASICSAYRYLTREATQERVKYVRRHIRST